LLPRKGGRGLGLGVGAGSGELQLLTLGAIDSCDLYDVTPQLVASAESAAVAAGLSSRVSCHVADINALELPEAQYDLITFFSSLHHVLQLEDVLGECQKALKPGGVFFAAEYVGPNRFAFTPDQVGLARQIWNTIDPALRCDQPQLPVPNPMETAAADPTEAIRSEEIISLCRKAFPATHVASEDVCLTYILWFGLNHDRLFESEKGFELVSWLLDADEAFVRSGRLSPLYADIFARK
jgi:SAM-dependent methyltransferase